MICNALHDNFLYYENCLRQFSLEACAHFQTKTKATHILHQEMCGLGGREKYTNEKEIPEEDLKT